MNNIIKESLNKGVPVGASIDLKNADLLNIVDDKNAVSELLNKHFQAYMEFIRSMGETYDIEYFYTLSTIVNPKTLERKIIFAPSGYFCTLIYNLNLNNACKDTKQQETLLCTGTIEEIMSTYREPLKERLEILRKVKNPDELKKQFPFLYNKYQTISKENQTARTFALKLNKMSPSTRREYIRNFDIQQSKTNPGFSLQAYLNKALNFNIRKFVESSAETLEILIDNHVAIINYIQTHPIDLSSLSMVDQNKLELYLAYRFLITAEKVDIEYKQDYLYYISNYFSEHKDLLDSELSIVVGSTQGMKSELFRRINPQGDILTPALLYDRYRQLLVENPNLRAIDFSHLDFKGMTVPEVETFMSEYLKDLSAQWDFLLPEDRSYEEEIVKRIRKTGKGMTEEEKELHQQKLLDLLLEKKSLYDSSDPFFRVKGKGTFDGYIGFIYPNGRVVLDKLYDDAASAKVADGHAVYAMGIQEFYELSRLSKSEIIRNKLCTRYIHKGNWAERVLINEIQVEGSVNPSVEVQKLIKTGDVIDQDNGLPNSFSKKA